MSDLTVTDCVKLTCTGGNSRQGGSVFSRQASATQHDDLCGCRAAFPAVSSSASAGALLHQPSLQNAASHPSHLDACWDDAGVTGKAAAGRQRPWGRPWSRCDWAWCDWAWCGWAGPWFRGRPGAYRRATRPGRFPASGHSCTPCVLTADKLVPGQVLAPLLC